MAFFSKKFIIDSKNTLDFNENWFLGVFGVADYESEVRILKYSNPIWRFSLAEKSAICETICNGIFLCATIYRRVFEVADHE